MKRVVFSTKENEQFNMMREGWLFIYAGLRLIALKECTNSKWWSVYEYSTGYDLGSRCSKNTRTDTILAAHKLLDRLGSLRICKGIQAAINQSGILNNRQL